MTEPTAKEKTIIAQYAELNKFGQNGEYDRALKAANKILGLAPQEKLAFRSKIVCLIHLSKFEEAISLINKNPEFSQDLIFEKAYCYYRVNKHEEGLQTLEKSENQTDYNIRELRAQLFYKLERFEEAARIYQGIIKYSDDEYENERYTNLNAAMVYMDPDYLDEDSNAINEMTYELCYNRACLLITSGNYYEAERKLKMCELVCQDVMAEDEASDEEIDIELALIRTQLAYVYQKQGRIKEAQFLYSNILKLKLEDVTLTAITSNNLVCINKDQNLFDSKKKMKTAFSDSLTNKLLSVQRKYIALNNAILNYYINQPDQCEKTCKIIEQNWPDLLTEVVVLRALNLLKAEKPKEAIDYLTNYSVKDPSKKLYLKLCIAQFLLIENQKEEACKILENLEDDSYKPGIVGALTSIYLGMGDETTALKVFEKTVEFYKENKLKSIDLSSLWRQAAEFHIKNGHPQVAANSLEELLKTNKDDKRILAQLVLACSQFDKDRAQKLSKELPSIRELSKGVDIENLQALSTSISVTFKKSPANKQDSLPSTPRVEEGLKKTRKHKKRKGKLPKNYDPTSNPDPERWLPKYERSGYRRKRDRRTKDVIIKGSQGTSSGQADQYDFSKYVEEASDSPASTVEPSPRGKQGQHYSQRKGQQKRKNKRR